MNTVEKLIVCKIDRLEEVANRYLNENALGYTVKSIQELTTGDVVLILTRKNK